MGEEEEEQRSERKTRKGNGMEEDEKQNGRNDRLKEITWEIRRQATRITNGQIMRVPLHHGKILFTTTSLAN